MKSAGGLAIGLVVSLLVFAFVAELCYLLWWKKKRISSIRRRHAEEEDLENGGQDDYAAATAVTGKYNAKELFHLICWKNPSTVIAKPDSEHGGGGGVAEEESVELELMRLHNLAGPPRFLFTIKEETKEDLVDSEDGRSRVGEFSSRRLSLSRSKSLSEIPAKAASPPSPPRYSLQGFNPLFESAAEAELNRLISSPPPTFKFMRDAEEKLIRRLMKESAEKKLAPAAPTAAEVREGSFLGFLHSKNREATGSIHRLSVSSQVTPLDSE